MKNYMLTFHFKVDEDYDIIHELFKYQSVKISFWKSFIPPHRVDYKIGPLTENGVNNHLNFIREYTTNFKYSVTEMDEDP